MKILKPGVRQFSRDAASSAAVGLGIAALGLATGSFGLYLPFGLAGGLALGLALHASTHGNPL